MTHTITDYHDVGEAKPHLVTGRWRIDTCTIYTHDTGGWHMRFQQNIDLPPVLTIDGVAAQIERLATPYLRALDFIVTADIALSLIDPHGRVCQGTVIVTPERGDSGAE